MDRKEQNGQRQQTEGQPSDGSKGRQGQAESGAVLQKGKGDGGQQQEKEAVVGGGMACGEETYRKEDKDTFEDQRKTEGLQKAAEK